MLAALPRPVNSTTVRLRPLPIPGWLRSGFAFLGRFAPDLAAGAAARLFFTPTRPRRRPEQAALLARGRRFELESEGRPVVGWSWGQGAPVLLLHGWSGHAGQLAPFVEPLVERGRRVVALDLPAHGLSAGARTNVREFAAAIRRAGEIFGPFDAVIAHSFGCAATTLAMDSGFVARRAVFLAPPSRFETFVARMVEGLGLVLPVESRFRRAIQEWVGERFEEIEPRRLARHQDAELLIVHDRDDDEVRFEEGEEIAARWPGARLVAT
ncbi:MAG: alpha/beta fold hydrolase, partial [Acidobacteria bacterium]|nr:alpha/beta fold hydrolase [Acidobacteriota bacterium]